MSLELNKKDCIDNINHINTINPVNNLLFIANFSQLNHVHTLVDNLKLENCYLVVLYTELNYYIPQSIHDALTENLFEQVLFLKIPTYPNRVKLNLALEFTHIYSKILNKVQPKKLFLSSFQYHYSILGSLAKSQGVEIALVEEGLGTYRLGTNPNEGVPGRLRVNNLVDAADKTIKKTQFFKKNFKRYKEIRTFIGECKKFTKTLYGSPEFQGLILKYHPDKNVRFMGKPFLEFDESYTSFPDLTNTIFHVKESKFYFSHNDASDEEIENAKNIINKYNVTSNDYIFLSQKFLVDDEDYANEIKRILRKFSRENKCRIFIKTHPRKESSRVVDSYFNLEMHSLGRIKLIEESNFRIESVISLANVKGVLGITSTSLVYTSVLNPNSKVYSVAYVLTKNLMNKKNLKGVNTISDHASMLKQFDNINFLDEDY
ncbi:alpha-2,8-polysialyltransferase family protein [Psychrobacter glacincola]|uniref:alpha-2,8-polysialyltransferase family protein n=1 Tax=Psychrobacter glacincola TaxID=56810 RepID=UPI003FCF57DF